MTDITYRVADDYLIPNLITDIAYRMAVFNMIHRKLKEAACTICLFFTKGIYYEVIKMEKR